MVEAILERDTITETTAMPKASIYVLDNPMTPFQTVIIILRQVFNKSIAEAADIARTSEQNGEALVVDGVPMEMAQILFDLAVASSAKLDGGRLQFKIKAE